MHLPPYLSAVATPDKLGRNRTGKIKVTLDTEKLPKLGLTTASVYLSRFPGDKVGEENEIPVSAVLLPDFSRISQQERLHQLWHQFVHPLFCLLLDLDQMSLVIFHQKDLICRSVVFFQVSFPHQSVFPDVPLRLC